MKKILFSKAAIVLFIIISITSIVHFSFTNSSTQSMAGNYFWQNFNWWARSYDNVAFAGKIRVCARGSVETKPTAVKQIITHLEKTKDTVINFAVVNFEETTTTCQKQKETIIY